MNALTILLLALWQTPAEAEQGRKNNTQYVVAKMPMFIEAEIPYQVFKAKLSGVRQPQDILLILNQACPANLKKETGEIIIFDLINRKAFRFDVLPLEKNYIHIREYQINQLKRRTTADMGISKVDSLPIGCQAPALLAWQDDPLLINRKNSTFGTTSQTERNEHRTAHATFSIADNGVAYTNMTASYETFQAVNNTDRSNVFISHPKQDTSTTERNSVAIGNSVLFSNMTGNSNIAIGSTIQQKDDVHTRFLTVDAYGNVVLATPKSSDQMKTDVADLWRMEGADLRNTNKGGVIIGANIDKTPAGYKLYVAEGILTEKVKVAIKNTTDWSDKVFDANYKLRSLAEIEQYICQHHHLPDIPSADEVVIKGLDLGKMDAQLLQKIEELTLYVIELKKQNDYLRKRLLHLEYSTKKLCNKRKD